MKKQEIKLQNVIYCAFIVLIHLFTPEMLKNPLCYSVQRILFSAVFGFVFLSGLKQFLNGRASSIGRYYKARFCKIVLPYLAVCLLYLFFFYPSSQLGSIADFLKLVLTGRLASHFYFVIAITALYAVTPLIKYLCKRFGNKAVTSVSLFITAFTAVFLCGFEYYNILFTRYLFVYMLGVTAAMSYDRFKELLVSDIKRLTVSYIIAFALDLASAYLAREGIISLALQQLITVLYMPFAILFFFALAIRLTERYDISRSKAVDAADKASYYIYLFHLIFITAADKIISLLGIGSPYPAFLLRTALTALMIWALISAVRRIKKRL